MKFGSVLILFVLFFSSVGLANSKIELLGFKKPFQAKSHVLTGPIRKFAEVGPHFEVVIDRNAALYLLPKDKQAQQTRAFLRNALANKTSYAWEVEPMTQQIFQVRRAE